MGQHNTLVPSTPKSYAILLAWIFLIVFGGQFILRDAFPYFGLNDDIFGRFLEVRWWLLGHVSGGILAIAIGPFQFWNGFRNKYITVHRWLGRMYLGAILIGSISSTYLAWTTGLEIHWTWSIALQGLAFAWITTAAMAFISIKNKRIQQHKEWMIRSYVVTFAFVTFRWLDDMPVLRELGNFIERAPTEIWVSWAIPLLITEVIIHWTRKN